MKFEIAVVEAYFAPNFVKEFLLARQMEFVTAGKYLRIVFAKRVTHDGVVLLCA